MVASKHLVIVGGGFGGLKAAQKLARDNVTITLVDRRNHHLFQPLLYQVATASLAPGDIAEPIRHILARHKNISVLLDEAVAGDAPNKTLKLNSRDLKYDFLILAAGARHSYFGHDDWEEHAPGLKTIADALELRKRILSAFEKAEWLPPSEEQRRLMTFAVIGGGPTGVEMAGAIAEITKFSMRNDFRNIRTSETRVLLIEATDKVLTGYPEHLRDKAHTQLASLGVEVLTGQPVKSIESQGFMLGETRIDAATVVWAAGVQAEGIGRTLNTPTDRTGRVRVEPDLSVPGHPEVFVIGDLASFDQDGKTLPGIAQVALQMADRASGNIKATLRGKERKPFKFWDLGKMATIGRSLAVADVPLLEVGGFFAWVMWVFVHLMTLVTFRNRLVVFSKWCLSYLTHERGSRLIWQGDKS